ncbi:MAG: phage tail sheath C-terminal domain-containing protein [Agriterribacter sp.]
MAQINETALKTPGVYVNEISLLPPIVAQVETAIPAFIGYTEFSDATTQRFKPVKIFSLLDYITQFGKGEEAEIAVTVTNASLPDVTAVVVPALEHTLYHHIKMFFANGGSKCYIVSVGDYAETVDAGDDTTPLGLLGGLKAVEAEDEPTLLVIPEAVLLDETGYTTVVQAMLKQCNDLQDRFSILDVLGGDEYTADIVSDHRDQVGNNFLNYGASYFPFLKTSLTPGFDDTKIKLTQSGGELNTKLLSDSVGSPAKTIKEKYNGMYNAIKQAIGEQYFTLSPSATIAGVYASVDGQRGVWKAPANVSLTSVIEPTVKIDNAKQDDMNDNPSTGKSINVIRSFTGKGILVWGARTLEGNSSEWRYISVRRLFIMVEESVKKATAVFVFEPNDANTWTKVRAMIENYLTVLWRQGALAGAKPEHAFFVNVGLGKTMTAEDILNGKMIVEIGMAAVRPAEFIILRFSHKMQES